MGHLFFIFFGHLDKNLYLCTFKLKSALQIEKNSSYMKEKIKNIHFAAIVVFYVVAVVVRWVTLLVAGKHPELMEEVHCQTRKNFKL